MSEIFIDKDVISPQIAEMFKHVAAQCVVAGFEHMVLLPGSNAWVKEHGRLGVLGGKEDGEINIKNISEHFVTARLGIAVFDHYDGSIHTNGGQTSSFVAFKQAAERDALVEKVFEVPFYAALKHMVVKADWEDGKLKVRPDAAPQPPSNG